MKEKRYFCDYWFGLGQSVKHPFLIAVLTLLVITSISSIINYNVLISKHGNELNSYSESTYQFLDEIAYNVIQEGVGIDLLALPDDVVKYEITSKNNEVIFEYYLDNNKDMVYAVSAYMTVKLSDDFDIISKESNYSSKEDYVWDIKFAMIFVSIMYGIFIWVGFMMLGVIACTIVAFVSKANKNKNLS